MLVAVALGGSAAVQQFSRASMQGTHPMSRSLRPGHRLHTAWQEEQQAHLSFSSLVGMVMPMLDSERMGTIPSSAALYLIYLVRV